MDPAILAFSPLWASQLSSCSAKSSSETTFRTCAGQPVYSATQRKERELELATKTAIITFVLHVCQHVFRVSRLNVSIPPRASCFKQLDE
jgi:hypothetical protein